MHRKLLPVLFTFFIFSCSRPASEQQASSDTTKVGELPPGEDPGNDTAYNGNTDGDYFFPEADSTAQEEEAEEDEDRFVSAHTSQLDIAGFDNTGKYFVFTQLVPGDYAGSMGYVYVIDAAKNEWAGKPVEVDGTNEQLADEEIIPILTKKKDSVLRARNLKIATTGVVTDLTKNSEVIVNGQAYNVDLKVDNMLIDLRLKGNGKDIILQKDTKLPRSRGSVRAYRLLKAITFNDKIAVFVEYDGDIREGFENSRYYDVKYIAATAVVK